MIAAYLSNLTFAVRITLAALLGRRVSEIMRDEPYWLNLLYALDVLAAAMIGGARGQPISRRIASNRTEEGWGFWYRVVEWVDPGHSDRSMAAHPELPPTRPVVKGIAACIALGLAGFIGGRLAGWW